MEEFAKNYFRLLNEDYRGINLTRINDFDEFYEKQILDSIEPYKQSLTFKKLLDEKKILIDIGFGGGFPLLPLAKLLPSYRFIGIETRKKKVTVVAEIAKKLGLNNISFLHERIENCLVDLDAICTLKAVGKVDDFLEKINSTTPISVYFYKGPGFYDIEENHIKRALNNWNLIEESEIEVPNADKRYLVGFQNKNVPHGTFLSKQLVKVSSIH